MSRKNVTNTSANALILLIISFFIGSSSEEFELEVTDSLVECVECVQLWKSASGKESKVCSNGAKTCTGNACFMRQCKHCPVYQYMSGCVNLSPWQIGDLELNRRTSELRMRRVGAILLCEDTFNQTTCICNRRDKCNSIHSRLPFATYSEGLFRGVINFDTVIAAMDPRYLEVMSGYHFRFISASTPQSSFLFFLMLLIMVLRIFYLH